MYYIFLIEFYINENVHIVFNGVHFIRNINKNYNGDKNYYLVYSPDKETNTNRCWFTLVNINFIDEYVNEINFYDKHIRNLILNHEEVKLLRNLTNI